MVASLRRSVPAVGLVVLVMTQIVWAALLPEEAVDLMATRLDQDQVKTGINVGLWVPETAFTGPPTGGMACAYQWTGNPDYWESAELAGYYLLWFTDAQGNMLGDEVYAFMCLSEASDDPANNVWRSALEAWFVSTRRPGYEGSTPAYIKYFDEMEVSTAVFYIACHTVGAYYVDDQDKDIWRDALIEYLGRVDDEASFPVMALGVATWALAQTGPLDDTPMASYPASVCWDDVVLSDLPDMLASHQVPEGQPFAGSFYWRFDHSSGGTGGMVAGYTEDAIFGTFGLLAAASLQREAADAETADEGVEEYLDREIEAAQTALLEGVDEEGCVFEHLAQVGRTYYTYAGEMLEVLWSLEQYLTVQLETTTESDPNVEVDMEVL